MLVFLHLCRGFQLCGFEDGILKARSEASSKSKLTERDGGRMLFRAYLFERAQHGPFITGGKKEWKDDEIDRRLVTFHARRDPL